MQKYSAESADKLLATPCVFQNAFMHLNAYFADFYGGKI